MPQRYLNPAMKQLKDQQVRYAPRDVRIEQIERAEKLLGEIKPGGNYYYQRLCERITTYRPGQYPDLMLTGAEALHDIQSFIEDLSDSVPLPAEAFAEPVLSMSDVGARYRVTGKTVSRWRERGLVARKILVGGRKRVGFLQSSVERFVAKNAEKVERGGQFRQLEKPERERIIRRARRLARHGASLAEVSRRIARRFGRSPETIRYTIRNHDRRYPQLAVFPELGDPLTSEQKRDLYRNFRQGDTVERLAAQYRRTKSSIYRILTEVRAERLRGQTIDFMDSEEFRRKDAAERILSPPPEGEDESERQPPPPGLPPYLATLYGIPVLSRETEAHHFRKMNFLRYLASLQLAALDPQRPRASDMDRIESLLRESQEVKNFLIRSNLRLVVSIARRHMKPGSNFFEMVSDGNMALIAAIEKFDYSKGNKFSTYATWAVMKNFARSIPAENTLQDRFRTGRDEVFQLSTDTRANPLQQELRHTRQHQALMTVLDQLDSRERDIIVYRFGLGPATESETLEQVGQRLGVTKERIRQLESRALEKLRRLVTEENIEFPGL